MCTDSITTNEVTNSTYAWQCFNEYIYFVLYNMKHSSNFQLKFWKKESSPSFPMSRICVFQWEISLFILIFVLSVLRYFPFPRGLSFCPLDIALVLTSDNFHSILPPSPPLLSLSCSFPGGSQSHEAIFTVCSHTFILFWLKNPSMSINSISFLCLGDLLIFQVRISPFYFCFM